MCQHLGWLPSISKLVAYLFCWLEGPLGIFLQRLFEVMREGLGELPRPFRGLLLGYSGRQRFRSAWLSGLALTEAAFFPEAHPKEGPLARGSTSSPGTPLYPLSLEEGRLCVPFFFLGADEGARAPGLLGPAAAVRKRSPSHCRRPAPPAAPGKLPAAPPHPHTHSTDLGPAKCGHICQSFPQTPWAEFPLLRHIRYLEATF